jgi:hypothetical protein
VWGPQAPEKYLFLLRSGGFAARTKKKDKPNCPLTPWAILWYSRRGIVNQQKSMHKHSNNQFFFYWYQAERELVASR